MANVQDSSNDGSSDDDDDDEDEEEDPMEESLVNLVGNTIQLLAAHCTHGEAHAVWSHRRATHV
jgi:hypothetical protein